MTAGMTTVAITLIGMTAAVLGAIRSTWSP